jgi:hypothetical protein
LKKLRIHWPWHKVEKGQGFFVPCLDPEPVREEGLNKALEARIFSPKARVGIRNGRTGVLFYRKP